MHRIPRSMAAALALAPLLVGCSGPAVFDVCPAVGWVNTLEVRLSGTRADEVALVELCDGAGCSTPGPTAAAEPTTLGAARQGADVGSGIWRFSLFDMSAPEEFQLIAYGAGASEIERDSFTAAWHRTGGSERCGGPMATDPVEFAVG